MTARHAAPTPPRKSWRSRGRHVRSLLGRRPQAHADVHALQPEPRAELAPTTPLPRIGHRPYDGTLVAAAYTTLTRLAALDNQEGR